ncbi:hypothetical protein Dip518_000246 [Parelusimicrobium proximum]|uniref:hypothetical protein n=1 Tax=Parelusimicrobium proximum TaxID=3228953 RepID=UPI003D16A307
MRKNKIIFLTAVFSFACIFASAQTRDYKAALDSMRIADMQAQINTLQSQNDSLKLQLKNTQQINNQEFNALRAGLAKRLKAEKDLSNKIDDAKAFTAKVSENSRVLEKEIEQMQDYLAMPPVADIKAVRRVLVGEHIDKFFTHKEYKQYFAHLLNNPAYGKIKLVVVDTYRYERSDAIRNAAHFIITIIAENTTRTIKMHRKDFDLYLSGADKLTPNVYSSEADRALRGDKISYTFGE